MSNLIFAFEGIKDFFENSVCENLSQCFLYQGLALNVFTVLILAIVDFSKSKAVKVVVGDAWSILLVITSCYIIFSHTCLYTIITTVISFILLILISLSIADEKNVEKKDKEEKKPSSQYVIKKREGGTYSFFLYEEDKNIEIESKYTYQSIDDAVKAIDIIKSNCLKADKEEKLGNWSKYTRYPMFETTQNDKFFTYKLAIDERYTILVSKKFKKHEDCYLKMQSVIDELATSEVYISNEAPKYYESTIIDPFFNEIQTKPQIEEKVEVVKMIEVPVTKKEVVEEAKEEVTPVVENIEEAKEEVKPKIQLKNDGDDDDEKEEKEIVIVDGKEMYVTYRKSIFAKLTLARPETKNNYVELANYIEKYDVRRRDSWEFISYCKGKDTILKIGVKGRTLFVYYGLPFEEYKDKGYFLKEAKAKTHEKTPTVMRVKSDRAIKHAKELVDVLMGVNKITKDDTKPNNETLEKYNEKSLDDLLKDGYIKYLFTEVPKEEQKP